MATDYLETKILQHVFTGVPYTAPVTIYLALYTVSPTDVGTDGTEVVGGGYVRQPVAWVFGTGGAGKVSNNADVGFTNMPVSTVVAAVLMDAVTGGNMLDYASAGPLTTTSGETVTIAAAALNFYLG